MLETPSQEKRPAAPPAQRPLRGARLGVVLLLGVLCQALVIFWIAASEIPARVFISSWSVSMPGILLLAALGLLAPGSWLLVRRLARRLTAWPTSLPGARRQAPGAAFPRQSLLLVYIMVSVSGVLTGYSAMQTMFPTLGAVLWRATPENRWARFHPYLPDWLLPGSAAAVKGLFVGNREVPWADWLVPMGAWFCFLTALYTAMLCLAALLSRSWIHGERLTFPVAQLPLEMTSPERGLFRNRLMWLGFAIPAVLESLIALNYYVPSIPALEMKHRDMGSIWLPDPPFHVLRPFYFGFTPFIVGFAYLAPVDVSFSVWFFSLLSKAERVYGAMVGWDSAAAGSVSNRFPYPEEQAFGAFVAFALLALWRSGPGVARAFGRSRGIAAQAGVGEAEGGGSTRAAAAGLALSLAVALAFLCVAGMSPGIAAALLLLILLVATTLSRIRAEAGPAWAFGPYRDVSRALVIGLGSRSLTESDVTSLSLFRWVSRDVRFLPMPFQMEALKIADSAGIRRGLVLGVIFLATVVGLAIGYVAVLRVSYELGWGSGKVYLGPVGGATAAWTQGMDWLRNPMPADRLGLPWLLGGATVTLALAHLRTQFIWWPFHPIGYVMAETGTGSSFWFHYLLAWLLKLMLLRYGGHRLYVRSLPFVIGVILGDILTQAAWSAAAVLLDVPVYQFIS
jgi:hypothetical protein